MNTQIQILGPCVRLIHIPRHVYCHFLHPILYLLFLLDDDDDDELFVHISLSPLECSVICPTQLAHSLFSPIISNLQLNDDKDIPSISIEEYFIIQIDGEGNSQILELAAPLSIATIPIFFISSYFSDYLLAPLPAKNKVINILDTSGFTFSSMSNSYTFHQSSSSTAVASPATTRSPSPATDFTLEIPNLSIDMKDPLLVVGTDNQSSSLLPICRLLVEQNTRTLNYFAVTMAPNESISLIIPQSKTILFDNLLGSDIILLPITLDLRSLPENSTGIVNKVASILADNNVPMTYLSFVKAAAVLVSQSDIQTAIDKLAISQ